MDWQNVKVAPPRRRPWLPFFTLGIALMLLMLGAGAASYVYYVLAASRPTLSGSIKIAGLTAPVEIARDRNGVPTISGSNRLDLARALGFLHAQERFFQMDLLRRAGAGELSELVGPAALDADRGRRVHRFHARAQAALARQSPADRALIGAYTAGVNAGLAALAHAPWEYSLLRVTPTPWSEADTALVVYAMYFDLEDSDASEQLEAAAEIRLLGPQMAAFLYPRGAPMDAPLDGSHLPEPAMPANAAPGAAGNAVAPAPAEKGSNNFAVAGRLSDTGAAMVENDMHLDLRVPNIWYRARLKMGDALDVVGVTLPGQPFVVVGSNTHVAWALTDSYIETGDAVVLQNPPGDPTRYETPGGPLPFDLHVESICAAHAGCEDLTVRDTIWGPVVGQDDAGHPVVWRWIAHEENAVRISGFQGMENARTVRQALDAAHTAGLPDQNLVAGDADGHIGWTIIGQIPRRVGLNDQLPHSWADGATGWQGYLAASDIPEVIDPPDGRLWSANARMLGGDKLALLGDGFYANPIRARAIHDDLAAHEHFTEHDMLAIATDDRAHLLDPWQKIMLASIPDGDAKIAGLKPYVADWGGSAVPSSVGYRLVREFRGAVIRRIYAGLAGALAGEQGAAIPVARQGDHVALRLLDSRPAALVPKPFTGWDALIAAAVGEIAASVDAQPGGLAAYNWGARNHTGIHHPLALGLNLLGRLTDPPDVPVAGDSIVPRVAVPGNGASERIVVSPGHEDRAVFDMPMGQSDNPLSPYYGAGQEAWLNGAPTPLLPGPAAWRLELSPAN